MCEPLIIFSEQRPSIKISRLKEMTIFEILNTNCQVALQNLKPPSERGIPTSLYPRHLLASTMEKNLLTAGTVFSKSSLGKNAKTMLSLAIDRV